MFAPPPGPSSCSIGVCVLLLTSAVMAAAGTALIPITCPARIGVTPSGLPIDPALGAVDRAQHRGARARHPGNRPHPEQGFRTCLGVVRLFKDIDPERAELIAARAVAVRAPTTRASPPSSPTSSKAVLAIPRTRSSNIPICAAPVTSIERIIQHAHPSHPRPAA